MSSVQLSQQTGNVIFPNNFYVSSLKSQDHGTPHPYNIVITVLDVSGSMAGQRIREFEQAYPEIQKALGNNENLETKHLFFFASSDVYILNKDGGQEFLFNISGRSLRPMNTCSAVNIVRTRIQQCLHDMPPDLPARIEVSGCTPTFWMIGDVALMAAAAFPGAKLSLMLATDGQPYTFPERSFIHNFVLENLGSKYFNAPESTPLHSFWGQTPYNSTIPFYCSYTFGDHSQRLETKLSRPKALRLLMQDLEHCGFVGGVHLTAFGPDFGEPDILQFFDEFVAASTGLDNLESTVQYTKDTTKLGELWIKTFDACCNWSTRTKVPEALVRHSAGFLKPTENVVILGDSMNPMTGDDFVIDGDTYTTCVPRGPIKVLLKEMPTSKDVRVACSASRSEMHVVVSLRDRLERVGHKAERLVHLSLLSIEDERIAVAVLTICQQLADVLEQRMAITGASASSNLGGNRAQAQQMEASLLKSIKSGCSSRSRRLKQRAVKHLQASSMNSTTDEDAAACTSTVDENGCLVIGGQSGFRPRVLSQVTLPVSSLVSPSALPSQFDIITLEDYTLSVSSRQLLDEDQNPCKFEQVCFCSNMKNVFWSRSGLEDMTKCMVCQPNAPCPKPQCMALDDYVATLLPDASQRACDVGGTLAVASDGGVLRLNIEGLDPSLSKLPCMARLADESTPCDAFGSLKLRMVSLKDACHLTVSPDTTLFSVAPWMPARSDVSSFRQLKKARFTVDTWTNHSWPGAGANQVLCLMLKHPQDALDVMTVNPEAASSMAAILFTAMYGPLWTPEAGDLPTDTSLPCVPPSRSLVPAKWCPEYYLALYRSGMLPDVITRCIVLRCLDDVVAIYNDIDSDPSVPSELGHLRRDVAHLWFEASRAHCNVFTVCSFLRKVIWALEDEGNQMSRKHVTFMSHVMTMALGTIALVQGINCATGLDLSPERLVVNVWQLITNTVHGLVGADLVMALDYQFSQSLPSLEEHEAADYYKALMAQKSLQRLEKVACPSLSEMAKSALVGYLEHTYPLGMPPGVMSDAPAAATTLVHLVGPAGCGRTTLFRMLTGIEWNPDAAMPMRLLSSLSHVQTTCAARLQGDEDVWVVCHHAQEPQEFVPYQGAENRRHLVLLMCTQDDLFAWLTELRTSRCHLVVQPIFSTESISIAPIAKKLEYSVTLTPQEAFLESYGVVAESHTDMYEQLLIQPHGPCYDTPLTKSSDLDDILASIEMDTQNNFNSKVLDLVYAEEALLLRDKAVEDIFANKGLQHYKEMYASSHNLALVAFSRLVRPEFWKVKMQDTHGLVDHVKVLLQYYLPRVLPQESSYGKVFSLPLQKRPTPLSYLVVYPDHPLATATAGDSVFARGVRKLSHSSITDGPFRKGRICSVEPTEEKTAFRISMEFENMMNITPRIAHRFLLSLGHPPRGRRTDVIRIRITKDMQGTSLKAGVMLEVGDFETCYSDLSTILCVRGAWGPDGSPMPGFFGPGQSGADLGTILGGSDTVNPIFYKQISTGDGGVYMHEAYATARGLAGMDNFVDRQNAMKGMKKLQKSVPLLFGWQKGCTVELGLNKKVYIPHPEDRVVFRVHLVNVQRCKKRVEKVLEDGKLDLKTDTKFIKRVEFGDIFAL